ncbi:MAG: NifB/NifX family molybdenum-iron cluster-binding protein [Bacillota bacterium]
MRVAITAVGKRHGAHVDPRFGRCNFLAIVDTQKEQWEFIPNPGLSFGGGAGARVARELAGWKVACVVTGHIGPDALAVLEAAGIEVHTGVGGTVQQVFDLYRQGLLKATTLNNYPQDNAS